MSEPALTAAAVQLAADQLELARGQMLAAYISAGAAVVQAFGAVAAIVFSIKLANESASREAAAQLASAKREMQAEQAAEARLARADANARYRAELEQVTVHNRVLTYAIETTKKAIEELRASAREYESKQGDNSIYMFYLSTPLSEEARSAVRTISSFSLNADLSVAVVELDELLKDSGRKSFPPTQAAATFNEKADKIQKAVDGLGQWLLDEPTPPA